jgi:hypothetical protein
MKYLKLEISIRNRPVIISSDKPHSRIYIAFPNQQLSVVIVAFYLWSVNKKAMNTCDLVALLESPLASHRPRKVACSLP